MLPYHPDECRVYARNFRIKDLIVRTVLSYHPGGCRCMHAISLIKDLGVRTVLPWHPDGCKLSSHSMSTKESWNLLELWWVFGRVAMTSGQMQPWTVRLLDTDGRPDAWLGCPNGNMGSDFYELESSQNLPWTFEELFYNEDSEIYNIPDYDSNITW